MTTAHATPIGRLTAVVWSRSHRGGLHSGPRVAPATVDENVGPVLLDGYGAGPAGHLGSGNDGAIAAFEPRIHLSGSHAVRAVGVA